MGIASLHPSYALTFVHCQTIPQALMLAGIVGEAMSEFFKTRITEPYNRRGRWVAWTVFIYFVPRSRGGVSSRLWRWMQRSKVLRRRITPEALLCGGRR